MPKIYVLERLPDIKDSILLQLIESKSGIVGGLFQEIPAEPFKTFVTLVRDPAEADYFMLPHNYFDVAAESEYLMRSEEKAIAHNKKIIVFAYGDKHDDISLKNTIILRSAKYRSSLKTNEFIVPAFVEDLGALYGIEPRTKADFVTVGFAGWVKFTEWRHEFKYRLRLIKTWVNIKFKKIPGTSFQGLYYRRRAISRLQKANTRIKLLLYLRSSYSGNVNTIGGSPEVIRNEFVSSIKNSDLPLVVRGDGNYSLRFFEVLSLGRVPLFIDTDTPLPLEDKIDYDSFILRIPSTELNHIESHVTAFWDKVTDEEFQTMQVKARQNFIDYLSPQSFYRDFFAQLVNTSHV